jgi:spore coat polysaccharide biosynthesis protein SpsF
MYNPIEDLSNSKEPHIPLIVQARSLSTRYPHKILQEFSEGRSLLEFQLVRLKKAFPLSPIVVATTTSPADKAIEDIAINNNVYCFRGDEINVLERFVNCCKYFNFTDFIVRICSDNPFLQLELLKGLIRETVHNGRHDDYISYSVNHIPAIRTHFGFFAEVVRVAILDHINTSINTSVSAPYYREHVTSYIYEHQESGSFKIRWLELSGLAAYLDSIRLTIDSKEDFNNALSIYDRLRPSAGDMDISWDRILSLVDSQPGIKADMHKQILLYQK